VEAAGAVPAVALLEAAEAAGAVSVVVLLAVLPQATSANSMANVRANAAIFFM
jgi:hypothetical protein